MRAYRVATAVLSLAFVGIGIALLVEAALTGGTTGFLLGVLFVGAGVGRLYLTRPRP